MYLYQMYRYRCIISTSNGTARCYRSKMKNFGIAKLNINSLVHWSRNLVSSLILLIKLEKELQKSMTTKN